LAVSTELKRRIMAIVCGDIIAVNTSEANKKFKFLNLAEDTCLKKH
jgi:hypothetical protein